MTTEATLGPLPEPWIVGGVLNAPIEGQFTASQMRKYAAQEVAAERERCARIVDDLVRMVDGAEALAAIRGPNDGHDYGAVARLRVVV